MTAPKVEVHHIVFAWLECGECGAIGFHRWPATVPLTMLTCRCGATGCLDVEGEAN